MTDWKEELRDALRTAPQLAEAGYISKNEIPVYEKILSKYGFLLPRYYASLIELEDPHCPIRLQAIPSAVETVDFPGYLADPLGDTVHKPAPRITHRYPNRALVHLTPNCSMYCRFCFRKSLINEEKAELFEGEWGKTLEYLNAHPQIEEVILSGGDPLLVSDSRFESALKDLAAIPGIKRLRIHSRVPVTLPSRVTEAFIKTLSHFPRTKVLVAHFNHPKEITSKSLEACNLLREAGVQLLNQSVLLKGINDSSDVLAQLSEELFENRILPYYLHHPDRAQGTEHFGVSLDVGMALYHELKKRLPGYLVPKYVIDCGDSDYKKSVEEVLNVTKNRRAFFS